MKAIFKESKKVTVKDVPLPILENSTDVLIEIALTGLCRTDVRAADGTVPSIDPLILGHEFSGTVKEIGSAVKNIKIGDRVTVMPIIPCNKCDNCQSGYAHVCQNAEMMGLERQGAFTEFAVVPDHVVYKLPDNVSMKVGAYAEPMAASLAPTKASITKEQKGLIYGDNRIAELTRRIMSACGYENIQVYDHKKNGRLPANSYDYIIETFINTETMEDILNAIKPRGTLVLKSRQYDLTGLSVNTAVRKEIKLEAVAYGDFYKCIELISEGKLYVDDLFGNVFPFEQFKDIFEQSKKSEPLKQFFSARVPCVE